VKAPWESSKSKSRRLRRWMMVVSMVWDGSCMLGRRDMDMKERLELRTVVHLELRTVVHAL
jgi:hypothetical protein